MAPVMKKKWMETHDPHTIFVNGVWNFLLTGTSQELSRAHTPHVHCMTFSCESVSALWFDDPYLNWAWACTIETAPINYAVLGAVNRCGPSKSTISSIHGPCLAPRSKEESFYWQFDNTYCSLWHLHLEICWFSVDNNDNNNDDPLRMRVG